MQVKQPPNTVADQDSRNLVSSNCKITNATTLLRSTVNICNTTIAKSYLFVLVNQPTRFTGNKAIIS